MDSVVSLVPAPATSFTESPSSARTARSSSIFSAVVVVGDSPVVPARMSESQPLSVR